jgi:predicted nucleotidyltransferase
MIKIIEAVVGSRLKLGTTDSDIDTRGCCIPDVEDLFNPRIQLPQYEWTYKEKIDGVLYDRDMWELRFFIRSILAGKPLLFSCLFAQDVTATEEGKDLIKNRNKLMNQNMVKGTLLFTDSKIKASESNRRIHHQGKYIYYAISDLLEAKEIIEKQNVDYPLKKESELLHSLKTNDENLDLGRKLYYDLKEQFASIKHSYQPDLQWIDQWCINTYLKYINGTK